MSSIRSASSSTQARTRSRRSSLRATRSSSRPGVAMTMSAWRALLGLRPDADAAVDRRDLEVPDVGDRAELLGDLARELTGRREDQAGRAPAARAAAARPSGRRRRASCPSRCGSARARRGPRARRAARASGSANGRVDAAHAQRLRHGLGHAERSEGGGAVAERGGCGGSRHGRWILSGSQGARRGPAAAAQGTPGRAERAKDRESSSRVSRASRRARAPRMIPVPEPRLQPPALRADIPRMAKVLLIDDEPDIRRIARLLLEPYGHEVILGEDGLRGAAMAQHQRPDVIILDLMMPILDGHATLEMLRGDERTAKIPVVVLDGGRAGGRQDAVPRRGRDARPDEAVRPGLARRGDRRRARRADRVAGVVRRRGRLAGHGRESLPRRSRGRAPATPDQGLPPPVVSG